MDISAVSSLDGLFWLAAVLVALLFLQRRLHLEVQSIVLIATHSFSITTWTFALLFLPGVLLHELSHYFMAKLLGVRTGNLSLIPEPLSNGKLRLGYVEIVRTDYLRDSLVGAAPLIVGMLVVSFISIFQLHLVVMWDTLRNGQMGLFMLGLQTLPSIPHFWFWFYLTFMISSTMLPSESDRYAWTPLMLILGVLFALALLAGAGPWMLANLAPPLNDFLRGSALILLVSVVVHAILLVPLILIHRGLTKATGWDVN
jgi:hypothetical protein